MRLYKRHFETEKHNYYALTCNGVYIRSRATWIKKREKSNSYFLGLEKKRQLNNAITRVKGENEDDFGDNDNIMKCLFNFYNSSYTSKNI